MQDPVPLLLCTTDGLAVEDQGDVGVEDYESFGVYGFGCECGGGRVWDFELWVCMRGWGDVRVEDFELRVGGLQRFFGRAGELEL